MLVFAIVMYPTNLNINLSIKITPGENNFDRSTFEMNIVVKEVELSIDSKQFSDFLDFAKFQNYSKLYGE